VQLGIFSHSKIKFPAYFDFRLGPSTVESTRILLDYQSSIKTLSFASTLGNGPVVFNSRATSFMLAGPAARAGLAIGALEDNDDTDDTTAGNCDWVLSFRNKPKLYSLAFTETRG
jgi:hypothetical protein